MPKRSHTAENKENEPEQGAVVASDLIPAKRIKTDNEPLQVQVQVQVQEEPMQFTDEEDDTDDDDNTDDETEDEEEEEVEECEGERDPIPISDVLLQNEGAIHPTFKQYFAYEGTDLGMVSKTARFWSRKYLKIFPHVNPDVYDMYVHNDFVSYGEVEIVENCLLDLAKGTFLKLKGHLNGTHQLTAFRRLEALTIVLEHADNLPGIDDGERFVALTRVIGACYVSILASISPKSLFHGNFSGEDEMRQLRKFAHQLSNFKQVIQRALIRAYFYASIAGPQTAYINVLKTIYCNWSLAIEQVRIDPKTKPAVEDEYLWRALQLAATVKRGAFKESFNFLLELDTYAKMNPGLGGNAHDLRKWSKARRQQYSFDNEESEPATNFWFRL